MKLLKSVEELLYELVSWLVFYPLTMWRSLTKPLEMMRYADNELADTLEDQYDDTLSPPLFLLITLLLAHTLSTAFPTVYDHAAVPEQLRSGSNLLVARGVVFGVFPLVMSVVLLRRKAVRVTRNSLRPPFYSQCFVTAPFAFALGLAVDFIFMPNPRGLWIGLPILLLAFLWYGLVQVRWFRRDLQISRVTATFLVVRSVTSATIIIVPLAIVIGLALRSWST